MYFHENEFEFQNFIRIIKERENIDTDIIEKDYYVCTVLKELAKQQDYLKAFKLMQDKYIFKDEYRITIEETQKVLNEIRDKKVLLSKK